MADHITPGIPGDSPMPFDDFDPDPPRWPKVVGGFSIAFACLGLVCNVCMVGMASFGASMLPPDPTGAPLPPWANQGPMLYVQAALSLLLSLLLLAAGLTTLGRRPVARPLHLVWAVLGIIAACFGLYMQVKMNADNRRWALDNPQSPMAQGMNGPGANIGPICGYVIGVVFGFAWPIFCLIWFGAIKRKPEQMTRRESSPTDLP